MQLDTLVVAFIYSLLFLCLLPARSEEQLIIQKTRPFLYLIGTMLAALIVSLPFIIGYFIVKAVL